MNFRAVGAEQIRYWTPGVSLRLRLLIVIQLCLLASVACGNGTANARSQPVPPKLSESIVAATGNPLVATYTISTDASAAITIQFGPTSSYGLQTSADQTPLGGGSVSILVAGMRQNATYHMRAVATYSDGSQQFNSDHVFQTGTIPAERIPSMQVTTGNGSTPAPGVELVSLTIGNSNQLLALALDPAGNVIWYYDYDPSLGIPQPIKLLPNGHMLTILYLPGAPGGTVREVDLAGNIIRQFDYNDLNQKLHNAGYNIQVYSIDHDILQMPNGHWVLVVSDTRIFTDLPGYPGQTTVTGNAVVDVDPNNNPVWVWDAFDHLDVNRHPMFFPDWTHANALAYSADDGNLLLSLRHQSWVLKLDYQNGTGSGNILWKLGYQGDFALASDLPSDWFFAQHDVNISSANSTGNFQLAMFDNGDYRVLDTSGDVCSGFLPPLCYSTAATFDVNEIDMTAAREWSYTTPYSWWGGSTRLLFNNNLFVDETAPLDLNLTGSRVLELTQTSHPTTVWQLVINGQASYRTIHLTSLYPGVKW